MFVTLSKNHSINVNHIESVYLWDVPNKNGTYRLDIHLNSGRILNFYYDAVTANKMYFKIIESLNCDIGVFGGVGIVDGLIIEKFKIKAPIASNQYQ